MHKFPGVSKAQHVVCGSCSVTPIGTMENPLQDACRKPV